MVAAGTVCLFRSSAEIRLENVALRQQLNVLRRSAPSRPRLTSADRIFWIWLRSVWQNWKSVLVIVQPETVVGWHGNAFRTFWNWKMRRGKPGRPPVPAEIRRLILGCTQRARCPQNNSLPVLVRSQAIPSSLSGRNSTLGLSRRQSHMTRFRVSAIRAAIERSVANDAASDACADHDAHKTLSIGSSSPL
jgi:hypothetical protein